MKSPVNGLFVQQLVQANNKDNKVVITDGLACVKGQYCRKYSHGMMSSFATEINE